MPSTFQMPQIGTPPDAKLLREFREQVQNQGGRPSDEAQQAALSGFTEKMRAILTPEQAARFDERVQRLRPEPVPAGAEEKPDQPEAGDQPMP